MHNQLYITKQKTAHTKHKDEDRKPKQPAEETSKLSVGDRCKNYKDNSTSTVQL